MKRCAECGFENKLDSVYCMECGNLLAIDAAEKEQSHPPSGEVIEKKTVLLQCAECGFENESDSVYCAGCGKPLKPEIGESDLPQYLPVEDADKSSMTIRCPECEFENEQDAVHCTECGAVLKPDAVKTDQLQPHQEENVAISPTTIRCPNCKYENEQDVIYCIMCRAVLKPEVVDNAQPHPLPTKIIENRSQELKTIHCPRCGNVNLFSADTCLKCGFKLVQIREILTQSQLAHKLTPSSDTPSEREQAIISSENCDNRTTTLKTPSQISNPPKETTPSLRECPYCGHKNNPDAVYCYFCERRIKGIEFQYNRTPTSNNPRHMDLKRGNEPSIESQKGLGGVTKFSIILAFFILLALLVTNTDNGAHTGKIVEAVVHAAAEEILDQIPGGDIISGPIKSEVQEIIEKYLGKVTDEMVDQIGVSLFTYHNYYLFSTTSLNDKTISVGVFNSVFMVAPVDDWARGLIQTAMNKLRNYINNSLPNLLPNLLPGLSPDGQPVGFIFPPPMGTRIPLTNIGYRGEQ